MQPIGGHTAWAPAYFLFREMEMYVGSGIGAWTFGNIVLIENKTGRYWDIVEYGWLVLSYWDIVEYGMVLLSYWGIVEYEMVLSSYWGIVKILWNMERWCGCVPRWGGAAVPSLGLNDRQMRWSWGGDGAYQSRPPSSSSYFEFWNNQGFALCKSTPTCLSLAIPQHIGWWHL